MNVINEQEMKNVNYQVAYENHLQWLVSIYLHDHPHHPIHLPLLLVAKIYSQIKLYKKIKQFYHSFI